MPLTAPEMSLLVQGDGLSPGVSVTEEKKEEIELFIISERKKNICDCNRLSYGNSWRTNSCGGDPSSTLINLKEMMREEVITETPRLYTSRISVLSR